MPDPRFYATGNPLSIAEIIALTEATLLSGDEKLTINRVAESNEPDLDGAIIYFTKSDRLAAFETKNFGLCILPKKLSEMAPINGAVVIADSPKLAFSKVADRLHMPLSLNGRMKTTNDGVIIDETSVISDSAKIGAGAQIGPNVFIGPGVEIGEGAIIEASVSISCALIGKQAAILSGAKIGQAGFGFVEGPGGLVRVPQLGRVVIGDDVEIGANTTVDRGALSDTIIGEGTKIDNLVQIGHNVRIGRNCVIAAQTGISGSCVIGDGVFMGGQVGLSDHLTIGSGARIAAGSGLMRDVPAGEAWGGIPAKPVKEWLRETAALGKLTKKKSD